LTDAFELAWMLLKEEVEEEEPPADPTPPPMSFRQRLKNFASNMGVMFGGGSWKERGNRLDQQIDEQWRAHEQAFQAQQQALQDAEMAQDYGHQDPAQMSLDDFYGHELNTEEKPKDQQLMDID